MMNVQRRLGLLAKAAIVVVPAIAGTTTADTAHAQGLTVLPVSIKMEPGQRAATLTVINQSEAEASFQVRAFSWAQQGDADQLAPTDELLASPPLGTMAPGATQVVRIVLRRAPAGREASYRILLDQIPPPAAPGMVRIALRLSIPVFAEPDTRVAPQLSWHIEGGSLVVVNAGTRHEVLRDIALGVAKVDSNAPPYVLAGAMRRWRILGASGGSQRLTAKGETGAIDQQLDVGR